MAALDGKPRTYRGSNILTSHALEAPAQRPGAFDLAGYWAESVEQFERNLYQATAHATGLALQNAVNAQQQSQVLAQAVATRCVQTILGDSKV